MAKKKGRSTTGGRGKTGTQSKTQVELAWCSSCHKECPVVHVQTLSVKKRWSWNCTSCGAEVCSARRTA